MCASCGRFVRQLGHQLGVVLLHVDTLAQELGQVFAGHQAILHVMVEYVEAIVLLALRRSGKDFEILFTINF